MGSQKRAKQNFSAVTTTLFEQVLNVKTSARIENVAATIPVNLRCGELFKPSFGSHRQELFKPLHRFIHSLRA